MGYNGPYLIGDNLTLACHFDWGKPIATRSWYTGSKLMRKSGTALTIHNLQPEDDGTEISCIASNEHGTIISKITIEVVCK